MTHFAYRLGLPLFGLVVALVGAGPGCSPPDPCQGQSSSCLTVQVETQGDLKVDLLRTIYSINGGASQQQGFATASNGHWHDIVLARKSAPSPVSPPTAGAGRGGEGEGVRG